jgi:hypothetical protein
VIKKVTAGIWLAAMTPAVMAQDYMMDLETRILQLAADSNLAQYYWHQRGRAPIGYIKGMAVAYARVYQQWKAGSPATSIMAIANSQEPYTDALAWYENIFDSHDMPNDTPGVDTLRHLFVLLTGLGMRESSGKFCEGRDRSADNVSSDTAETGLFQMSWDAHDAIPQLKSLLATYAHKVDDLTHIFHEGVRCSESDLENYGDGLGRLFQETCKASPLCAILTAGVGLRVIRRHWGPINRREAEIRPEANKLFLQVQSVVDNEQVVAQGVEGIEND